MSDIDEYANDPLHEGDGSSSPRDSDKYVAPWRHRRMVVIIYGILIVACAFVGFAFVGLKRIETNLDVKTTTILASIASFDQLLREYQENNFVYIQFLGPNGQPALLLKVVANGDTLFTDRAGVISSKLSLRQYNRLFHDNDHNLKDPIALLNIKLIPKLYVSDFTFDRASRTYSVYVTDLRPFMRMSR